GEMAEHGHSIVLVSHKMEEILNHTHRVSVLRHGRNAGTIDTSDTNAEELASMMIGSDLESESISIEPRPLVDGSPVLQVDGLVVGGDRGLVAVDGATLEVRAGQIVGVAGVAGNGQRELQEAIAGLRSIGAGSVRFGEVDATRLSPRARSEAGLAYVPEDRLGTGLARGMTLEENLTLKNYYKSPQSHYGVLSTASIESTSRALTEQFDVRGAREGMPVSLMSGGNLQKAILARELTQPHDILLAASPTRGLDLAAAAAVHGHLRDERAHQRGVLLFSEDLAEIAALSDIILVIYRGRIVGSYLRQELDLDELGLLMTGAKAHL
ncbi:MAG: ATP-binding cassette domain-containing protein, partial [Acidimicrobiales bacterium]